MKRPSYKFRNIHRKTPEPEQCAMIIPKHKQHRLHTKKICHLMKTVIEMKPLIKMLCFVGTDKSITICIEKEIQNMS